ncbi:MAG: hypothetical protein WBG11_13465 [Methylocella sp.]
MAIAAIPQGKSSRAAPGHRPWPRNISRAGISQGHYHGDALLILTGVFAFPGVKLLHSVPQRLASHARRWC